MDSKLFWGVVIILIGVSIIINHVFKIDFPLFKVIIALLIIWFGFSLLFGSFNFGKVSKGAYSNVFSGQEYAPDRIDGDKEFNAVFGSAKIDLRNTEFTSNDVEIEMNAVFGAIKVFMPKDIEVSVEASSAFGSVKGPGHRQDGLGEQRFTEGSSATGQRVRIEANAAFGSIQIE